jgi:hypothetical protein
MANNTELGTLQPDPAAIFAAALSLWEAVHERAEADKTLDLSDCYNGTDQLMREVMRIANLFETWACQHVAFDELDDVWPYLLEDKFGAACLAVILPSALAQFDETDCLRVAIGLRLPITLDDNLPLPIDLLAPNPVPGSQFREFRIQTVRNSLEDGDATPFTAADDPFDEEFGSPYFGLYGVGESGLLEHVADRNTFSDVVSLAQKLAPGVQFPLQPVFEQS